MKKGYISLEYVIVGALCCFGLLLVIPTIKGHVNDVTLLASDGVVTYEAKTGSYVAKNPSSVPPIDPDNWVPGVDDPTFTIITKKLFFEQPFLTVDTDEMITISPISQPDDISYPELDWMVVSGGNHATIIQSLDTRSLEITGKTPGRIVIQAKATDGSGKLAYAYIDVIRKATSISLDKTSVNLKVGKGATEDEKTAQVEAIVAPADTNDKSVVWAFKNSNGSECLDISSNNNILTLKAKKPVGLTCDKTVVITATTSNNLSTELIVNIDDIDNN